MYSYYSTATPYSEVRSRALSLERTNHGRAGRLAHPPLWLSLPPPSPPSPQPQRAQVTSFSSTSVRLLCVFLPSGCFFLSCLALPSCGSPCYIAISAIIATLAWVRPPPSLESPPPFLTLPIFTCRAFLPLPRVGRVVSPLAPLYTLSL